MTRSDLIELAAGLLRPCVTDEARRLEIACSVADLWWRGALLGDDSDDALGEIRDAIDRARGEGKAVCWHSTLEAVLAGSDAVLRVLAGSNRTVIVTEAPVRETRTRSEMSGNLT